MFGDEPPLKPAELIYQRMLARDPVEAAEQAEIFLQENTLAAFYDQILLGGLQLAQNDAERGLLDNERMQRVRDAVAEIVDDLETHQDKDAVLTQETTPENGEQPLASFKEPRIDRLLERCRQRGKSEYPFYVFQVSVSWTRLPR